MDYSSLDAERTQHELWDRVLRRVLALVRAEFGAEVAYLPAPKDTPAEDAVEVPVRLPDGRQQGVLRLTGGRTDDADLRLARVLAGLVGERLAVDLPLAALLEGRVEEVRAVLDDGALGMAFQPIVDLRSGVVVGVEALARFGGRVARAPNQWFADAAAAGLGVDLEMLAVRHALRALDDLRDGVYLSVNVSPEALASRKLARLLAGVPLHRLVLELTEHAAVTDYRSLNRAIARLRSKGARLAIDDAGSGFASLRHILRLTPDIIKLDVSLTNGIDTDSVLRALAYSLSSFARAIDASVVAEGVETEREVNALRFLGVEYGQGFYLRRPMPLPMPVSVPVESAVSTTASPRSA